MHAMTVRLDDDLATDLELIAEADGETVADALRAAATNWVAARRRDPNVQAALRRRMARAAQLLEAEALSSAPRSDANTA